MARAAPGFWPKGLGNEKAFAVDYALVDFVLGAFEETLPLVSDG